MIKQLQFLFLIFVVSIQANAQSGEALNFDGNDDYISVPDQPVLNFGTGDFTIEANFKSSVSQPDFSGIVSKDNSGTPVGYQLVIVNNRIAAEISDMSNGFFGVGQGLIGSTLLTDGNWHHLAMIVNRSSNQVQLLVDGNIEANLVNPAIANLNMNDPSPLLIGVERTFNLNINGNLDEVRLWNTARTRCELISFKNCEIPASSPGLVANYHFNQGLAMMSNPLVTSLTDSSGNAITGTLNNVSLTGLTSNWISPGSVVSGFSAPVDCPSASALNFDGLNDIVTMSPAPSLNDLGLSGFTLESWVYPNSASGVHSIIRKSGDYNLYMNNGNLCAEVWPLGTSDATWKLFTGTANLALNAWSHVVFTWNGTSGALYINGSEISSTILNGSIPVSENLNLGASTIFGNYLNGSLDEVRIWNVTRTKCEINTFMNCEIPASASGLVANYHFNHGLASYSNPTKMTLQDFSGNSNTGTLSNFNLTGVSSNWLAPGGVINDLATSLPLLVSSKNVTNALCNGAAGSATLTASGGTAPYAYLWSTGAVTSATALMAGVYTATVTDVNSCTSVKNVRVTEPSVLSVITSASPILCNGESSIVTVTAAGGTMPYTGLGTYTIMAGTTSYTVNDDNACVATTTVTVNEPAPIISSQIVSICDGQSLIVGTSTYTAQGIYSDLVSSMLSGCDSTITTDLRINNLPVISVNNGVICAGQSFTIVPSGALTYTFSNGSNTVVPASDITYTVTGTDANGCEDMAISSVTVNVLPTITVNSGTICAGQSFTMIPSGAQTFTYSNGSNVDMPTTDASYTITGTDINGCEGNATSLVTVNTLPILSSTTASTIICSGESVTLSVTGASSYTWSTNETTASINVSPTTQTTYTVDGTDTNGCTNTTTITQDVSLCTGIALINNSPLVTLYPNPNNGLFYIELIASSQVIVTNPIGQIILTETMNEGKNSLTIQNQTAGIYFVKVIQDGKQHTIKLIKE